MVPNKTSNQEKGPASLRRVLQIFRDNDPYIFLCITMSKYDLLQEQRERLPTFEFKQDLIDAIREYSILVVIGETGMRKFMKLNTNLLFVN